ncbi:MULTISPECIES: transporter [unclassified Legionella]|uniref:transporter n=1 Tax=unclassified Legionella TaxID=2622702 RepID=UPI001F5FE7F2|nr:MULTISPECIES: transporter [unclassified Legionella]MDI9819301.1 transporter [Legionella sp. PL877]
MFCRFKYSFPAALIISLMVSKPGWTGPWLTGPLLAPAGHTIPKGHSNLELYGFYTVNEGIYNRHWRLIHTPRSESTIVNPIFSHGLTDKLDIQYAVPYIYNHNRGSSSQRLGDTSVTLGYQLLEQKESKWLPDLRVTLQEVIPTGRFESLNPLNNGADATGLGSYQTGLALNFQHLMQLGETHYLRSRFSVGYLYASSTSINGLSSYGGTPQTSGSIDPGNLLSVDLAGELTLTQNWVAVMEAYYASRSATRFRGFVGNNEQGLPASIGHADIEEITLAPAIEYNFSPNIGIIAGPWFSVRGRETSDFISYVVAFNAYW